VPYFVADSPVDCHRDHLIVGRRQVKVLCMKEPPAHAFANILGDLLDVPGEFIACLEWQRINHVNYVSSESRPEKMLVDESATTTVKQLGDALTGIK